MDAHSLMNAESLRHAAWRKSSSSASGSTCVEIARNLPGVVAVRDSTDPSGPALVFGPAQWAAFLTGARGGGFDLA